MMRLHQVFGSLKEGFASLLQMLKPLQLQEFIIERRCWGQEVHLPVIQRRNSITQALSPILPSSSICHVLHSNKMVRLFYMREGLSWGKDKL